MAIEATIVNPQNPSAEINSVEEVTAVSSNNGTISAEIHSVGNAEAEIKRAKTPTAEVAKSGGGGDVLSVNGMVGHVTLGASDVHALPDNYTPPVTKVNNKIGNVTLTASDVGALPDSTVIPSKTSDITNDSGFITSSDIPVTKVNNKTGNVNLTASDVGALPDSTVIPSSTSDLLNDSGFVNSSGAAAAAPVQSVNGQTGAVVIDILNLVYPVGSIYLSVSSTNPGTLFGGTWDRIKDRFLLAAGDSYSAGATGGAASHNHSAGSLAARISNIDNAAYGFGLERVVVDSYNANIVQSSQYAGGWAATSISTPFGASVVGTTDENTNMPPYLAVYVWKRTA